MTKFLVPSSSLAISHPASLSLSSNCSGPNLISSSEQSKMQMNASFLLLGTELGWLAGYVQSIRACAIQQPDIRTDKISRKRDSAFLQAHATRGSRTQDRMSPISRSLALSFIDPLAVTKFGEKPRNTRRHQWINLGSK